MRWQPLLLLLLLGQCMRYDFNLYTFLYPCRPISRAQQSALLVQLNALSYGNQSTKNRIPNLVHTSSDWCMLCAVISVKLWKVFSSGTSRVQISCEIFPNSRGTSRAQISCEIFPNCIDCFSLQGLASGAFFLLWACKTQHVLQFFMWEVNI